MIDDKSPLSFKRDECKHVEKPILDQKEGRE